MEPKEWSGALILNTQFPPWPIDPTSVTLPLAFQASNEVTQYEVNTVEHSPSFSFVGLGGQGVELEEFLKEQYYLSLRSMFIRKKLFSNGVPNVFSICFLIVTEGFI